jgi:NADH-quinone oxidoreductase subunit N
MTLNDLIPFIPELLLSVMGMVWLIAGAVGGNKSTTIVSYGTGATFVLAIAGVIALWNVTAQLPGGHVGVGPFEHFIKVLLLSAALGALVLSQRYLTAMNLARPEYPVLMLFATLGMMLMVSAESLLGLYVGLELQSLTLYVMAAMQRDNARSSEAGLKYFVLGALASGLLLYGISLIYGTTGTVMFDQLRAAFGADKPPIQAIMGLVFILAGLAFKISAVPFHMWTPDVYEGAPTPVTAFFASAPKLAAIALLIKTLFGAFPALAPQAQQIIVVLSLASMIVGSFAAIVQSNIKRLMAYSSIGHVGFALTGLVAMNGRGVEAALIYLLIYLPTTLGAFGVILSLRRDGKYLDNLSDLAGLSKTRPALAAVMALFMFSMIGIPPLAGFFGKLYVFTAAVDAGFAWLAVLGVVLSVVGAYYYLRIIKIMYFDAPQDSFDRVPGWGVVSVLTVTTAFVLAFIVWPELAARFTHPAAQALMPVMAS